MREGDIMRACMKAASDCGARVWRNNVGSLQTKDGRWITYGVCNPGGSDLIGFTKSGVFLAIEVKTDTGRIRPEQQNFIDIVNQFGGIGFIAKNPKDVVDKLSDK